MTSKSKNMETRIRRVVVEEANPGDDPLSAAFSYQPETAVQWSCDTLQFLTEAGGFRSYNVVHRVMREVPDDTFHDERFPIAKTFDLYLLVARTGHEWQPLSR